jgi:hypothetical protein
LVRERKNQYLMIDSTIARAHQRAATRRKKGALARLWGALSGGGLTSKIHLLAKDLGLSVDFLISGGQVNDCTQALGRLRGRRSRGQGRAPAHTPAQAELRHMVLDAVVSTHIRRNYSKALDDLLILSAGRPLSRALLMDYRAAMDGLSPSTVNVCLSAVRKMVSDARKNGMFGAEEATNLTEVPNIPQKGTRLGNWLTREQARERAAVPDRSTLKGKRDYVLLGILVGCALRREELAGLDADTIQLREGRWALADLEGKGRRVRNSIPTWRGSNPCRLRRQSETCVIGRDGADDIVSHSAPIVYRL